MTNITLSNLSSETLEKLKVQAQAHGRSLLEEIQYILETIADAQSPPNLQSTKSIQAKAMDMQEQLKQQVQLNSEQLENVTEQPFSPATAFERLNILKQTISSLGDLTIRQAIEEGRRF